MSEEENDESRRRIVTLNISSRKLQARKRRLKKNLKNLKSDQFPDLTLRCTFNQTIRAHKVAFAMVTF